MLGRSLKQGKESQRAPEPAPARPGYQGASGTYGSKAAVEPLPDTGLTERFRQACVQGITSWCDVYWRAMYDLNRDKIPGDAPLLIEEIYFRVAVAINTKIAGFMMSREVSMIQNSIAVIASMMRSRLHEADPSLLSYLESAHDMLRRLDPVLWARFDDVVRYVLPLRIKCMSGWEFAPEVSNVLERRRRSVDSRDMYPLANEQVGYIKDLLSQEDVEQAQRQVIKLVSTACLSRHVDSRVYPIRLQMTRAAFTARLDAMSPIEILSVVLGFNLAGRIDDTNIPRPQDDRMKVNSLHFLLGEGLLFPLNSHPIVEISYQLINTQLTRASTTRPAYAPLVFFPDTKTMFKRSEDGSLSQGMSSSGEDISSLIGVSTTRARGQPARRSGDLAEFKSIVSSSGGRPGK